MDIISGKRAQIAGQVFIYIIAIVVVGLIVAYGYSAIKGFTQRGEEVEYITLRTGLENSVKSIVSDYGSIKRPDIDIPGKYEMVCFVDKGRASDAGSSVFCGSGSTGDSQLDSVLHQPIACSGWKTGRDNVFLIPDGSDSFDVGTIVISNAGEPYSGQPFICFDVVNNKIKMQLKGLGDKVEVSKYG
ncbi:hypothetical protein JW898_01155 [Candidatus Woesearchaeota archaeon]|nr:hypothetical protein [Candidatus Woesearchaeota archaeon]